MTNGVPLTVWTNCTTASTTHLMWVGRWIEVKRSPSGWIFKNGYDAGDWLLA